MSVSRNKTIFEIKEDLKLKDKTLKNAQSKATLILGHRGFGNVILL